MILFLACQVGPCQKGPCEMGLRGLPEREQCQTQQLHRGILTWYAKSSLMAKPTDYGKRTKEACFSTVISKPPAARCDTMR